MILIAGKTKINGVPQGNISVQALVIDNGKNIKYWSDVVKSDDDGRYQMSMSDILEAHQDVSYDAKILIAAWNDDLPRADRHEQLASVELNYFGEPLLIGDIDLHDASTCDVVVSNNTIVATAEQQFEVNPKIEVLNQKYEVDGEIVFNQSKILNIYYSSNGMDFSKENSFVFYSSGEHVIYITADTVDGITISEQITVSVLEKTVDELDASDLYDVERETLFFNLRGSGIQDNLLQLVVFASSNFNIKEIYVYVDGSIEYSSQDFLNPVLTINVQSSESQTRDVKVVAIGENKTTLERVEKEYEATVKNFSSITGDIAISYNAETGIHTAALNINNPDDVVEILWQITFDSAIIQKIIKPENEDDMTALINVLYQKYTDSSAREISFETLHGGTYTVEAYMINGAGAYYKAHEQFIVPGDDSSDEELVVGDTVFLACKSNHGEVPIMNVNRLSRDGFEEIGSYPMDNAYDDMYTYEHTIENDNSFLLFQAGKSVVVKKVGIPRGCLIAFSKDMSAGKKINYELKDFNGNVADSGEMTDTGFGVYYHILPDSAHGLITVGKTTKVM